MESVLSDVRYATRLLVRSPGFAIVTILTLALGIGANAAIFSTVDAVLLRALPFGDPDRLVMVWEDNSAASYPRNTPAPANYADWKLRNRVFEDIAASQGATANLTDEGRPELVVGRAVTPNFFSVLRVQPIVGRTFTEEEDREGAQVVVISYPLWQRRLQGDPSAIGATLTMNGTGYTVIGVMPPRFVFRNREIDYWVPVHFTPAILARRTSHYLNVVARLKPGITVAQAREDMRNVAAQLEAEYPEDLGIGTAVVAMDEELVGNTRLQLQVLMGAAGAVLLIACANLASLLLSRAVGRKGELGVRAALGAPPERLVRQLLVEALLLSTLGGMIGLLIAPAGIAVVMRLVPVGLAQPPLSILDPRMLAFTAALSVTTGLVFGALPAIQAARSSLNDILHSTSPRTVGGQSRFRDVLVVVQVAAALVLLVSAGLMLRTLANLRAIDLGFRAEHLLTVRTTLPTAKYRDGAARVSFYERVLDRVRATPAVTSAAYGSTLPFLSRGNTIWYGVEAVGHTPGEPDDALLRTGTGTYLSTLGVAIVEGRLLDDRDAAAAPPVIVVNETLARLHWPTSSALGHRIQISGPGTTWYSIVGVVRDVRERGYEARLKPGVYLSYAQAPNTWAVPEYLVVRTAGDPLTLTASVRAAVSAVDPDQPVSAIRTMEDIVDIDVADRTQQATLLGAFAALALILASVGLYGVLSYAVTQRRREIGVRMALGATRVDVMGLVIGRGMLLTGIGLVAGGIGGWILTRTMQALLYGVTPNDPATFAAVIVLLTSVGAVACLIPAMRATGVNPIAVLRDN
ncbi:MAG TPA: ABC transporter permease [Vicinamibacterales bacterium]|jgi:putative ABC transport system permease protein